MAPHISEISIFCMQTCKFIYCSASPQWKKVLLVEMKCQPQPVRITQDLVCHDNVFLRVTTSVLYKMLPGKSINR